MYRAFMRTIDEITEILPTPKITIRPTVGGKSAFRQASTS